MTDRAETARARLAKAFRDVGDPGMEKLASEGYYGDFTSPLDFPITQLVIDCQTKGYMAIATRAMEGEFDG